MLSPAPLAAPLAAHRAAPLFAAQPAGSSAHGSASASVPGQNRAAADALTRWLRHRPEAWACGFVPPASAIPFAGIARHLLHQVTQRFGGEVFTLQGGALFALIQPPSGGASVVQAALAGIANVLGEALAGPWPLADHGAMAVAFVQAPPAAPGDAAPPDPGVIPAAGPPALHRNAALLLRPGQPSGLILHNRLTLSPLPSPLTGAAQLLPDEAAVEAALALLERLAAALTRPPPWLRAAILSATRLLLALPCQAVHSPAFAHAAQAAAAHGLKLAVEITLADALAAPALYAHARTVLAASVIAPVLGGVDAATLAMLRPEALAALAAPGLICLGGAQDFIASPEKLAQLAQAARPAQLILGGCDTAQALALGRGLGILRFEGAFAEQVLAAARMSLCPHAPGCSVAICVRSARATAPEGRERCANPGLLDHTPPWIASPPLATTGTAGGPT